MKASSDELMDVQWALFQHGVRCLTCALWQWIWSLSYSINGEAKALKHYYVTIC